MRSLDSDQLRILAHVYDHVVRNGAWPGARALRLDLYKRYRLKLEDVAHDIGSELIVCNDVTADSTVCLIHLRALQYVDAAAADRELIGKFVAWLVRLYLDERSKGLTREEVAEALSADQRTADRIVGFVHYTAGLTSAEVVIGNNILGCTTFGIDDRIIHFDGVDTYEGLLNALDGRAAAQRQRNAEFGISLPPSAARKTSGWYGDIRAEAQMVFHLCVEESSRQLYTDEHYKEAVRSAFE